MRALLLTFALASATTILGGHPVFAEAPTRDLACEICRMKDRDGGPCKGKVTRESTSSNGIKYSCANGHTFTVEPKVKIR